MIPGFALESSIDVESTISAQACAKGFPKDPAIPPDEHEKKTKKLPGEG